MLRSDLCILILLGLLMGCAPSSDFVEKYGKNYNLTRKELGIPQIPKEWCIQNYGSYFDCVSSNLAATNKACRSYKRVQGNKDGEIIWETDYYISGKMYTNSTENEIMDQRISITYHYQDGARCNQGWEVIASLSATQESVCLSWEQAEQELFRWGIDKDGLAINPPTGSDLNGAKLR